MRGIAILMLGCVSLAGCTGLRDVLQRSPDTLAVEIPDGQKEIQVRAGTILHLPIGPVKDWRIHRTSCFTVNGKVIPRPALDTGAKTTFYVFQPEKAGSYRIEYRKSEFATPVVPDRKPDRAWSVTVTP